MCVSVVDLATEYGKTSLALFDEFCILDNG